MLVSILSFPATVFLVWKAETSFLVVGLGGVLGDIFECIFFVVSIDALGSKGKISGARVLDTKGSAKGNRHCNLVFHRSG